MDPATSVHINWLAVIIAALAAFFLGAIWYGLLFGNAWKRASGVTPEMARATSRPKIFLLTFLLNLIAAASLAAFIGPAATLSFGLFAGFMTGLTFVSTALGVIYLFEMRNLTLWLVNSGYQVVMFSAMGAILGSWH
jgi:hypothetical protein